MPLVVPNEGEARLLLELLDGGTARENWTLKLYKSDTTPGEADVPATYTECDFTNYTSKTLTRTVSGATWNTPAAAAPAGGWSAEASVAESPYNPGAPQSWTCGATGNTVYGYYYVGATSGKLIGAERFDTPRTLASSDVLTLTPRFGLA